MVSRARTNGQVSQFAIKAILPAFSWERDGTGRYAIKWDDLLISHQTGCLVCKAAQRLFWSLWYSNLPHISPVSSSNMPKCFGLTKYTLPRRAESRLDIDRYAGQLDDSPALPSWRCGRSLQCITGFLVHTTTRTSTRMCLGIGRQVQ